MNVTMLVFATLVLCMRHSEGHFEPHTSWIDARFGVSKWKTCNSWAEKVENVQILTISSSVLLSVSSGHHSHQFRAMKTSPLTGIDPVATLLSMCGNRGTGVTSGWWKSFRGSAWLRIMYASYITRQTAVACATRQSYSTNLLLSYSLVNIDVLRIHGEIRVFKESGGVRWRYQPE